MIDRGFTTLEGAIRDSGEGWLIDRYLPPQDAIAQIKQTLQQVDRLAAERFGEDAPRISEEAILREYQSNPSRMRGFFQLLGGTRTPEMLLMAWRLTDGLEIKSVSISYQKRRNFEFSVNLLSPTGGEEGYHSSKINDFVIMRHVGIMELGDEPIFDGFYPVKSTASRRSEDTHSHQG